MAPSGTDRSRYRRANDFPGLHDRPRISMALLMDSAPYLFLEGDRELFDADAEADPLLEELSNQILRAHPFLLRAAVLAHLPDEGPGPVAGLVVKKLGRFWADLYSPRLKKYQPAAAVLQWSMVILGLCGFLLSPTARRDGWPLLLPILYSWLVHGATVSTMRYGVPFVPLLLLLAFWGLTGPSSEQQ